MNESIATIDAVIESLSRTLLTEPRTDAEMQKWIWKNETLPRLKECGFSDRHAERITDWNCAPQESVFRTCKHHCRGVGAIIALVGVRGCGKTTICAQIAREAAENESLPPWDRVPPYRKLQDLVERYKPLYGNMGTMNPDALAAARDWYCSRPQIAFIDETHECDDAQVKHRLLTDIIDRRYAAKRDTILVSNQTPEEFAQTIGDSILSRLSEHGQIIPCTWPSWREKQPTFSE
jgi:DNA replication protein DnaC